MNKQGNEAGIYFYSIFYKEMAVNFQEKIKKFEKIL